MSRRFRYDIGYLLVHFKVQCNEESAHDAERGVALLRGVEAVRPSNWVWESGTSPNLPPQGFFNLTSTRDFRSFLRKSSHGTKHDYCCARPIPGHDQRVSTRSRNSYPQLQALCVDIRTSNENYPSKACWTSKTPYQDHSCSSNAFADAFDREECICSQYKHQFEGRDSARSQQHCSVQSYENCATTS